MKTCPQCGKQNKQETSTCENQDCLYSFDSGLDSQKTELYASEKPSFAKGSFISGRYEIVKELGRGGMGIVYLVKDIKLRGRQVALKMIHPELVSHEEAKQRFIDEVLLCLDLHHPNIVIVYPLEESEQSLFFTMEYIPGKSLRQVIDERKDNTPPFFTLQETVQVINPVLDALSYAHKTTIHRDIKPENIIFQGGFPDVQVKILDFGIAKVLSASRFTRTAQSMGTAYYMSPEQMQGAKHIDHRSDLYAVGMILYEMLTGYIAAGRFRLPGEIIKNLPEKIDNIVDKVLSPIPDKRHQNATVLKSELSDSLAQMDVKQKELEEKREKFEKEKEEERKEELEKQRKARRIEQEKRAAIQKAKEQELEKKQEKAKLDREQKQKQEQVKKEKEEAQQAAKARKKKLIFISMFLIAVVVILTMILSTEPERVAEKTDPPITLTPSSKPTEKPLAKQCAFHITTKPSDAKIKILNIVPKFKQGIKLDPGKYKVEVSAAGYVTLTKWHTLQSGKNNINIELTRKAPVQKQVVLNPQKSYKKTWTDPVTGMEFVWVSKGCFQMGSNSGDSDEKPVHEVCVDGFWMAKYEVTIDQFRKYLMETGNTTGVDFGDNDCPVRQAGSYSLSKNKFGSDGRQPMLEISWHGAKAFVKWLNTKGHGSFSLPSEAQWEYAARSGGKNEKYSGGSDVDRFAWYYFNSGKKTHNVGTKSPNGLGIYDMSGNVWEWCEDVYDKNAYSRHSRNNPLVTSGGSDRVVRGGSWYDGSGDVRCADRFRYRPSDADYDLGFRLIREN
ncbi:MAG: SUMF1/EgtB/PvdO family nonheme iron enzyme [Desulfobacula sp.]|nr:SUMF1/EgtB/PvdO family nonheme iron enzyme [Desulfobacula sp.]